MVGHLYEEKGIEFLQRLDGMFALILYDRPRNRMILALDPVGIKPLYYVHDESLFAVASEIKAFRAHLDISHRENPKQIPYLFSLGYAPDRNTFFDGVWKLRPGVYAILGISEWELDRKTYFSLPSAKESRPLEPLRDQIRDLLRDQYVKD